MNVETYLFFNGCCEEALGFYTEALGARVVHVSRYKESPEPLPPGMVPAGWDDKIMHASFTVGSSTVMASDAADAAGFKGFSMSISVAGEADADRVFGALAAGGEVTMPLAKTFWSPKFGMCTDRFGVPWMVNVDQ